MLPEERALAWEIRLRLPRQGGSFVVHVEASGRRTRNPRVLRARRVGAHSAPIRGRVCEWNPDDRLVSVDFPREQSGYPAFASRPFPAGKWIQNGATDGNNVTAETQDGETVCCAPDGSGGSTFPADGSVLERAVVNAFYWCNVAHDFFYLLGFDERVRNFQRRNLTGLGKGGDPVLVTAWDFGLDGIAEFLNRLDGSRPELNLGTFHARHSGLDTDVVLHEYVHGVVNRTIGNGGIEEPLTHDQPRALGEGYCDYFALTLQDALRHRDAGPRTFGAWIANGPTGLRPSAYGDGFTATYGSLSNPGYDSHHDAGQVWCQALLDIHAGIIAHLGSPQGEELAWQAAFDALKRLASEPTWLQARDALLAALRDLAPPAAAQPIQDLALAAFGVRGLGPAARCPSTGYAGIQEDVT